MPIPRVLSAFVGLLRPARTGRRVSVRSQGTATSVRRPDVGRTATVEVAPPGARSLTVAYAPDRDGNPDAGEIVWTWVPYAENDGRGKDRPVLVIGRHGSERVYAVRLTSKPHNHDRDYVPLGAGEWDASRRPSWVDIDQLYSVHVAGMRREAAALDRTRFRAVAAALRARYGWRTSV